MSIKLISKMYIKDEKIEYIYYILSRHCADKKEDENDFEKIS